jgi:hypothetical protein
MSAEISVGTVLFGDDADRSPWVVRRLMSLPSFAGCIAGLALRRRAFVELELAARVASVLDTDLAAIVRTAWSKADAIRAGLEESSCHPDDRVVVPLATHDVKWSERPVLEVYLGAAPLGRVELDVAADVEVRGGEVEIVAGRVERVLAGEWSAVATLSTGTTTLARRETGRRPLPGALSLRGLTVAASPEGASVSRLIVHPPPRAGSPRVELASALIIGRHPSCGLVLWDDPMVVNHHAAIHLAGGATILEDLGSAVGTSLNGRRISAPAILRPGDSIGIGHRNLAVA